MAFAIMIHLIVIFYQNSVRILYFGLLEPQWTRSGGGKEKKDTVNLGEKSMEGEGEKIEENERDRERKNPH